MQNFTKFFTYNFFFYLKNETLKGSLQYVYLTKIVKCIIQRHIKLKPLNYREGKYALHTVALSQDKRIVQSSHKVAKNRNPSERPPAVQDLFTSIISSPMCLCLHYRRLWPSPQTSTPSPTREHPPNPPWIYSCYKSTLCLFRALISSIVLFIYVHFTRRPRPEITMLGILVSSTPTL